MMKPGGATRSKVDKKDLSFHRSFGSVAQPLPLLEYNYDCGKTMPDQIADGYFMACRGYTLADIAGDEDDSIYKHKETYDKICAYEGHGIEKGGDIREAAKFGCVMGIQRIDETTDEEALQHRRGKPYSVDKVPGYDWFDSFRLALRVGKNSISVGTIWFPEWENVGPDGVLTSHFVYDGTWDEEAGHNYKISGEKTINGVPTLCIKSWQGEHYGDKGWAYMDRETFNKVFDIYGTLGLIQPKYTPKDRLYVQLTILQRVVLLLGKLLNEKFLSRIPQFYA